MEIAGAHQLSLDYKSKCQDLHGHNWIIVVYCQSETLDENGMVIDFTHIKRDVHDKLDHKFLNDIVDFNPTAENIAKWIAGQIGPKCYRVTVQESEGNVAEWSIE
jgi:6-pyruvoyltetrahydropterin/6-carboxytetrahydropterin synthase